jgi:tetratricopeptide (TPR) repeat protein
LTTGESFTIEYTVSDIEGSGLNRVELWRKDEQSDWQEIKRDALSGGDGPISGSFSDAPSDSSKYWYGIHVADNAGNWNDEKNSNTDNQPGSYGPIEVEVIKVVVQGEESQQELVQEVSTSSSEWQYTGVVDAVQGNYDIAILCFDKAFELDPSFTLALYDKAVILNLQDKYDEAIYVCDKIIELDSRYGRAWNCKGYALLQQGRYDESIQALDKAIEIYPKYADAWHNKGEALQGLNRDTEASDAFAKADDLGYDGPTPIDFGRYWSSVN